MAAPTQQIDASSNSIPPSLRAVTFAFDALPLGVVIFDDSLRICYQNDLSRCILADGRDLAETLTLSAVDSRFEDWNAALRAAGTRSTPRRLDGLTLRPHTAPKYVNMIIASLPDPIDAAIRYGLLLLEDVSPRITMEQRLAVSERLAAVGKLCASVAHELNNPLDGILRYLNLALRVADDSTDRKLHEFIASARDGCQRLVHIVRSLLDFSRNSPPAVADQTLSRLIDEAVRTFEDRAAERKVAIFCRYPQADVPAVGGINLYQVFCNLIKNAIDAMPSGGSLTISAEDRDGEIVIIFTDTGTGLPPDADRLFQPFFTTKPPGHGTGLGLAVCKEMVERLRGTITAADRPDARGAVFTVCLPRGTTGPLRPTGNGPALARSREQDNQGA